MYYDQQASVQRLTSASTQTYSGHPMYPGPIAVNVQAASSELVMMAGMEYSKSFKIFSPLTSSGIYEQDRLIIAGFTYTVVGREVYPAAIGLPHIEFACERATP